MTVETFALGSLDTNAYVISEEGSPECLVFDCPDSPGDLLRVLKERKAVPLGLFLTHAHADHMAGVEEFRQSFPSVTVYQHPLEASWLGDPQLNLSSWIQPPVVAHPAEARVVDDQVLVLGPWTFRVLHVPGHSPGSVAYWFEKEHELIVGDVLFRSGVGRWDFPGSDQRALRQSLDRLCALPGETRVRPGHGGSTTIGREKESNPYLRNPDLWLEG